MQDLAFSSRYQLMEVLGSGGMGVVHRAIHRSLSRPVAIKFMRAELLSDESLRRRFLEEARAAAALFHSNITTVLDAGFAGTIPFLVTELVPGEPLSRLLSTRRWGMAEALEIARQGVLGLGAIHRLGIVHRDIKPTNLMVDTGPPLSVKILDFGLAKRSEESSPATVSGLVLGTPAYMAPEQALMDTVTPATDLYALTVVLYELLLGHAPFTAATLMELVHKHLHEPAPIPDALPAPLHELLTRGLAKLPAQRFQSAEEYRAALDRVVLERTASAALGPAPVPGPAAAPVPPPASTPTPAFLPGRSAPDPQAALWGDDPQAFAHAFRDFTLVQPNLRTLLKDLARFTAREADTSTGERTQGAFRALCTLAAATAGLNLVPFKLRPRAAGVAAWLATRACTLGEPCTLVAMLFPGAAPLAAALEAGDLAHADGLMRAGVSERTTFREAAGTLVAAFASDLAGEGFKFVSAFRMVELITTGVWQGVEEALVVVARACCTMPRDPAPADASGKWLTRNREVLHTLSREGGPPDAADLAAVEEGLREGGEPALDALLAVGHKQQGWSAIWEAVLLPFSRLMLRTGPQAGAVVAGSFAYLVTLRAASVQLLRGDLKLAACLPAVPLMRRALKSAALEPLAPARAGGAASLDAALDQGDAEVARAKVAELTGSFRDTAAIESLARVAACNGEPDGYVTRLSCAMASASAYQESTLAGRERHLLGLATVLARAPRDAQIHAELQRAGL